VNEWAHGVVIGDVRVILWPYWSSGWWPQGRHEVPELLEQIGDTGVALDLGEKGRFLLQNIAWEETLSEESGRRIPSQRLKAPGTLSKEVILFQSHCA
jgi:hypothetical protein